MLGLASTVCVLGKSSCVAGPIHACASSGRESASRVCAVWALGGAFGNQLSCLPVQSVLWLEVHHFSTSRWFGDHTGSQQVRVCATSQQRPVRCLVCGDLV